MFSFITFKTKTNKKAIKKRKRNHSVEKKEETFLRSSSFLCKIEHKSMSIFSGNVIVSSFGFLIATDALVFSCNTLALILIFDSLYLWFYNFSIFECFD